MTNIDKNLLDGNDRMFYTFVRARDYFIKKPIKTIFEIGARDCLESLMFSEKIPEARIFAFECNPATTKECRDNSKANNNIIFTEAAVSDRNGTIKFYPIDQTNKKISKKDGNPGASSLFKFKKQEGTPFDKYEQKEIVVPVIRLDSFMQEQQQTSIDLLWMDIQGGELLALAGLGGKIKNVGAIITEVEFKEIYQDQPLFSEIKSYLNDKGFKLYGFTNFFEFSGDAIFINKKNVDSPTKRLYLEITDYSAYHVALVRFLSIKLVRKVYKLTRNAVAKVSNKITWMIRAPYNKSYSQSGEDIIIAKIFRKLSISNPRYLDVGTNDPKTLNNTFLMYKRGASGTCVEPNPVICKKIKKTRCRDNVLNIAVSDNKLPLKYYSFDNSYFNTLSKEDASTSVKHGLKLIRTTEIEPKTLNEVLEGFPLKPDFISLDIEGYDEKVLRSFDFKNNMIPVWCVETVEINDNKYTKNMAIIGLMTSAGYSIYADTFINTIFVRNDLYEKISKAT